MDEQIRAAFDQIHATPEDKERTRAFLAQARRRRARPRRSLAAAAAGFLLVLCALGGYWAYFVPTSAISVETDSALKLEVNRFDQVVGVQGYGEGGEELAQSLNLQFMDYQQALELLLEAWSGQQVDITVTGENQDQCSRLLEGAEACGDGENVHCAQGSQEELEAAHHAGLPFGKYRAYLELQALDPSVTVEDVQGMSMAELRAWIAVLSDGESQPQSTPSTQTGQGWEEEAEHETGHGSGHGNGHGYGYGGPPW